MSYFYGDLLQVITQVDADLALLSKETKTIDINHNICDHKKNVCNEAWSN